MNDEQNATMTTIRKANSSREVRITTDATGTIRATHGINHGTDFQVLRMKAFQTMKGAERFAAKALAS